jgi:NADH:ubiquinone reductase (H+-translocating)
VSATRILVIGGGFGGTYTAYHLERIFKNDSAVEITLISGENYFLMTPLLFEAGSGVLEPRHAVNPIRLMLRHARFVLAEVQRIDFDARKVYARHDPDGSAYELDYDQIVIAVGGITNRKLIPGSEHALGFKNLGDAIFLRNRIIDLFELADVEKDSARLRKLLTFVIIGGGLVGVELMGELTEFIHNVRRSYRRIPAEAIRFVLVEATDRLMPEMDEDLAHYAEKVFRDRGVEILLQVRVGKIEPERITLPDGIAGGSIDAQTILLAAGVGVNPLVESLALQKSKRGRILVESTMRSKERPEVWALGDCAEIPDKNGKPYPQLAQHALREAKTLARNIAAVVRLGDKANPVPFEYKTMGMLASLSKYNGIGRVMFLKIHGFLGWWVWRTYYVMQMTSWERRIRVILDWTVALFFRNDVVKLDLFGEEHPSLRRAAAEEKEHPPAVEHLSS